MITQSDPEPQSVTTGAQALENESTRVKQLERGEKNQPTKDDVDRAGSSALASQEARVAKVKAEALSQGGGPDAHEGGLNQDG